MIDATRITQYDLTDAELQEYILFWILAAGKNGTRAAKIINKWIDDVKINDYIFDTLRAYTLQDLVNLCFDYSTGCQTNKARSIFELVHSDLDLSTCSSEDLESIFGIGMKTARCFIVHSRKDAQYAGLDTHMLKYLASLGYDVPKSTPTKNKYLTLEKIVVKLAAERKMSPAAFDLAVWNSYKVVAKTTA